MLPAIIGGYGGADVAAGKQRAILIRVLFITEHAHDVGPFERGLENLGYSTEVKQVASLDGFREALREYSPDIVLIELNIPGFDGVKALDYLRAERPDIPLILVSEQGDDEAGVFPMAEVERLPEIVGRILKARMDDFAGTLLTGPELVEIMHDLEGFEGEPLAVVDQPSLRFLQVSDEFAAVTGYSAAELLAMKSALRVVAADDVAALENRLLDTSREASEAERIIIRIIRKNGLMAQFEITARHYDFKDRKRIAMIAHNTRGVSRGSGGETGGQTPGLDVSTWTVADNSPGFAAFDLDREGCIRSWNAGAEQFTGFTSSEALGTQFVRMIVGDERAKADILSFTNSSAPIERIELESPIMRQDGKTPLTGITLTRLVDSVGAPSGFSAFLRRLPVEEVSEENLREREAQLHSLASHLQKTREEEKTSIARQLHDEFGQTLTALRMDLAILGRMIARNVSEPLGRGSLLEKISSVSEILEKAIKSARDMITELRPAVLDELGLLTAIQWQVLEFENKTGINCHITELQHDKIFDPAVSTTTFRILQEALDNVKRHSSATEAYISLRFADSNIVLEVTDNGIGIDADKVKAPTSIGIIGMRERVLALGGKLDVRGETGRGTTLTVSIPNQHIHPGGEGNS